LEKTEHAALLEIIGVVVWYLCEWLFYGHRFDYFTSSWSNKSKTIPFMEY